MEKADLETLPLAAQPNAVPPREKKGIKPWRAVAVIAFLLFAIPKSGIVRSLLRDHVSEIQPDIASGCEQVDALFPLEGNLKEVDAVLASTGFRNASIERLSNIVQIPSVSYDDMGEVEEDERFKIFFEIEKYLEATFPLVHEHLQKENVNTHGLLYTWKGSDSKLKPSILMAHQDVVPVEQTTIDTWTHPPFSGFYDGKYIWGRGASDCKNQLIAILESVETLLEAGFQPTRTLLLSFGFDEEISGTRGAGSLSPFILERYGKDSIAAIIDEGNGFATRWGDLYALPGVGEKGYTDIHVTVRMPGGHSSVPSDHTSIGVVSELITFIESDPYKPWLDDTNPYLGVLQCGAKYSSSFPKDLKHLLHKRKSSSALINPNSEMCPAAKKKHTDALAEAAAQNDAFTRYLMQTSQAVDLISGGAKVNALPERVEAVINHRINMGETPQLAQQHLAHKASIVAKRHNLTLYAYPTSDTKIEGNSITVLASDTTLDVAPATPLDIYVPGTENLSPWGVLSGTTRAIYGEDVKMAPGSMTGNTDTRYYWSLSKHIFRYGPGYDPEDGPGLGKIHTVDERQSVVAHINAVKFFATWIRNLDEAKLE